MKYKLDVFDVFKKLLAQVKNEPGQKLKCLKSDNGGEYCDGSFEEFCASQEIRRVKMISRNPYENGVAERMNMTVLERVRSMRIHAGLPNQFWADVVSTTVYLINRGPSVALIYGISGETWTGKMVNLNHLRFFSYISYVHVDLGPRSNLDPKSKRRIFIGYGTNEYD